jgi:uncharacterized protein (TIGR02996 family)
MESYYEKLGRVLRYNTEAERAGFEKTIDENPHEATNHLVYADWLQEQGDHKEAAFRRAIGEWFKTEPKMMSSGGRYPARDLRTPEMQWAYSEDVLPQWAFDEVNGGSMLPVANQGRRFGWNETGNPIDMRGHATDEFLPPHYTERHQDFVYPFVNMWKGYRDMEEGLRRAFYERYRRKLPIPPDASPHKYPFQNKRS